MNGRCSSVCVLVTAIVIASGCGSNPSGPTTITIPSDSIQAIVTQLVRSTAIALASGASHAKTSSAQTSQDVRPLDDKDKTTVQINAPYDSGQVNCATGGSLRSSGTLTGSLTVDPDVNSVFGQIIGRGLTGYNAWACSGGYSVNTAPEISDSTTITITGATRFSVDSTSGGGLSFKAVPGNNNPTIDCLYSSHISFDNDTLVAAWSATVACQGANTWSGSGSISLR